MTRSSGIETPRLFLRPWQDADRAPFARMNADPRVMEFFPALLSTEQSNAWIDRSEAYMEQHGLGFLATELRATGEFIGFIGLAVPGFEAAFTPCVEIGWRLTAEHWGRGLATEGARAILRYGFTTLALREVVAFTATANQRSRRVMEKLGMTYNPADDFDHPKIPAGHPLRRHVLYRLRNSARP